MTITVPLPDEIEAKLRARLGQDDLVLTEFVRQAITEKLQREPEPRKRSAFDVWQECFTGDSSGRTDVAERDEAVLKAKFDAKRRDRQ